jgi:pimeloyl-[acyl-carrier protein] methyl ester esterase
VLKKLLAALAVVIAVAGPAAAQSPAADPNRIFSDSKLVVRDRFSDEIVGKGPDVIFIPGLNSSRMTWKATAERLRGHYHLHLIQVAGFAGEPARVNGAGEMLIPTAEAIDAYLVEQKLSPATVVGHSLGGTMSLYLAQAHPEHLKKVLIVDSWPSFAMTMTQGRPMTPDKIKAMAEQIRAVLAAPPGDPVAARAMLLKQFAFFTTDPGRQGVIADWSLASARAVSGQAMYDDLMLDLSPKLAANRVPITLVYPDNVPAGLPAGMEDKIYQTIYATMPNKTLKRVDASLHFVMWDNPQAFADDLDAFLAQK